MIVTTPQGSELASLVQNAGIVVPPEDPNSLVDGIVKLAEDPLLREELGQNGRKFAVKYRHKEVILQKFTHFLNEAIE